MVSKQLAVSRRQEEGPVILNAQGRPFKAFAESSYSAAGFGRELARWNPRLGSADAELLPEQETIVARTNDLVRNHGIASGAVQTHLDNVIGTGLRISYKPNFEALGLDASSDELDEWVRQVEAKFTVWWESSDSDAARRLNGAGRLGQGYRSFLVNGEIFESAEWIKRRGTKYRTAMKVFDPSRVTNKNWETNTQFHRAGVYLDTYGAAYAYDIRTRQNLDQFMFPGREPMSWKTVPRETPWGRTNIMHIFDQEKPDQTRGKTTFVSIISDMKMMQKFHDTSLQAAIVNAIYAAVIESTLDHANVAQALGAKANPNGESALDAYVDSMLEFHAGTDIRFDGVKIPHLFPGEKFSLQTPNHPSANFEQFEEALMRSLAAGFNLSYEQLSRDYSKTNYSSARASLLEVWRFVTGRRYFISARQAQMEFELWLEEAIDIGDVVLPPPAKASFYDAKAEWSRCTWIGPGRMHIDPLKESKADQQNYTLFVTTLEQLCAERGTDWEDVLKQRIKEKNYMKKLGFTDAEIDRMIFGIASTVLPPDQGAGDPSADPNNSDPTPNPPGNA